MKKLFAVMALVGIFLMLTERNGSPWAGTFIGTAMFAVGTLMLLSAMQARRERK